jgi:hypothetical protein
MLRGVNKMLTVRWLPHQPSHAFDDVSTPVFDRMLVIVIPFHIFESVYFPLPESQIIWHASHDFLDPIAVFEAWETQCGVLFLQPVVIIRLHAILLDPILDIFLRFTGHKRIIGNLLQVHLKETLSIAFPWLSNVIALGSTSAGVCFRPRQRRWQWLRLGYCDVFKVFEVGTSFHFFY